MAAQSSRSAVERGRPGRLRRAAPGRPAGAEHATLHPDAFHYQYVRDRTLLPRPATQLDRNEPPGGPRAQHGRRISAVQPRPGVPALFAYAHYLEDEMRLEEALDVLDTLLR